MVSRIFGFIRDMLLARILGAGGIADAWQLAFQLPNIFRRLFAEGAFAAAFVPLFSRRMKSKTARDSSDLADSELNAARHFANDILAFLIPILIVFSALILIAMPWILRLFASDALIGDAGRFDHGVMMARIAFPYLALMSLATLLAAILNSLSRFAAAAAAPIFLNLCLIAALLLGRESGIGESMKQMTGLFLAIAVSLSGLIQLLWLYAWARCSGFRLVLRRPRFTRGVREFSVIVIPAVFGAGIYQISRFIDLFFISILPDKSITYLALADRLNQLPLGIVGIALGTAILPTLSRLIAQNNGGEAARLQANALEVGLLLALPAGVALWVAGPQFAVAFYVGDNYTIADSLATGQIVSALVLGLPAYVLIKVLVPGFFARRDTRTPVQIAAVALAVNIVFNLLFIPRFGLVGLAFAGALAAWVNCALLYYILHRGGHFRLTWVACGRIVRITAAAAVMGAVLWSVLPLGEPYYSARAIERVVAVSALIMCGVFSFFAVAWLLGVVNRQTIAQLRHSVSG